VKAGKVLVEVASVDKVKIILALNKAATKLPIKTKILGLNY